jgi:hypothetical protein
MHCDHQLISDHLFDYIDEKLSPRVVKQVEQALSQCETCQASYRQAINLFQASHQWTDQTVPEWHRTEYAVSSPLMTMVLTLPLVSKVMPKLKLY